MIRSLSRRAGAVATLALLVTAGVAPVTARAAEQPVDVLARKVQWWLDGLGVTAAQGPAKGGEGVTVCLVDNGVDPKHPDLQGATLQGGTDLSGQGSPDGLAPVHTSDAKDEHGTAMAAWLVGQGHGANHDLGVRGVAPRARLMSVSIGANEDQGVAAFRYCTDHGATVISYSKSTTKPEAYAYAQEHDVVVVASSGNAEAGVSCSGLDNDVLGTVVVGGVTADRRPSPESCTNANRSKDNEFTKHAGIALGAPSNGRMRPDGKSAFPLLLAAPSGTADATGGYVSTGGGSSTATALTAGAATLVRAAHPDLNAANVVNRLVATAQPPADGTVGVDAPMGFGIVDVSRAVSADVPTVEANPLGSAYTGGGGRWFPDLAAQKPEPGVRGATGTTGQSSSAPGSPSAPATAAGPEQSTDDGGSSPVLPIVGGVVALLAIVGGAVALSRRNRGPA